MVSCYFGKSFELIYNVNKSDIMVQQVGQHTVSSLDNKSILTKQSSSYATIAAAVSSVNPGFCGVQQSPSNITGYSYFEVYSDSYCDGNSITDGKLIRSNVKYLEGVATGVCLTRLDEGGKPLGSVMQECNANGTVISHHHQQHNNNNK